FYTLSQLTRHPRVQFIMNNYTQAYYLLSLGHTMGVVLNEVRWFFEGNPRVVCLPLNDLIDDRYGVVFWKREGLSSQAALFRDYIKEYFSYVPQRFDKTI
ncbi:MAG: hypothetical protein Q4D04_11390, partial [Clostridia bacterium]|nr:hypothetical protein [Clostridia bacterium]